MTMQERDLLWEPLGDPGIEHLRVRFSPEGLFADGLVVRQLAGRTPLRLWYQIQCDEATRVRSTQVRIEASVNQQVDLSADGLGHWTDAAGAMMPGLDGCIDIDIAATPFTNTLPIRRLNPRPGESTEIDVVYITVPDLEVKRARQRYTNLRMDGPRTVYLYENCASGFRAELPVDEDGLVIDYQGQWRRRTGGRQT